MNKTIYEHVCSNQGHDYTELRVHAREYIICRRCGDDLLGEIYEAWRKSLEKEAEAKPAA